MTRIRTHTNPFTLNRRLEKIDFSKVFPLYNKGLLDLEIGFGRGEFITFWAKKHPDKNILGVEVRKQIVNLVQEKLLKEKVQNILLVHSSAQICLEDIVTDKSVENVFIFHPDPWFKNKHKKRRVINQELLQLCEKKLVAQGKIYISTDVEELFKEITSIFANNQAFKLVENPEFWNDYYKTNWDIFCKKAERKRYTITYQLV
jgi:tRNA (guanine-N7-)-methyltransferase